MFTLADQALSPHTIQQIGRLEDKRQSSEGQTHRTASLALASQNRAWVWTSGNTF